MISTLIRRENPLVRMIGQSVFIMPYHIQRHKPVNSVTSINMEMSIAFLSLIIFISCGNREAEVQTPAAIPTISSRFAIYGCPAPPDEPYICPVA